MDAARFRLGAVFAVLLLSGCASVKFLEDISSYETEVSELKARIAADKQDADAIRDLGIIYFQTQNYAQARLLLDAGRKLRPDDAKTRFYLGMSYEFLGQPERAIPIHAAYADVSRLSPYRRLMQGRFHRLRRDRIRDEMRGLLGTERTVSFEAPPRNAIAVFPLQYRGGNPTFEPLGRGLSEMLMIDLGHVQSLKLLERLRIQTLFDELRLAQTGLVNPQTAPRLGMILGAERLIAGSYGVDANERIDVDVMTLSASVQATGPTVNGAGLLRNLFRVEKELVFKLLAEYGLEITPEERSRIEFIPTQNLDAFLAYSLGLQHEDNGFFTRAAQSFARARALDPGFTLAADRLDGALSLSQAGGTAADAVKAARDADPALQPAVAGSRNLMDSRLQQLGASLGAGLAPGQDSRKPAEEAETIGVGIGELPAPPALPKRGVKQ